MRFKINSQSEFEAAIDAIIAEFEESVSNHKQKLQELREAMKDESGESQ